MALSGDGGIEEGSAGGGIDDDVFDLRRSSLRRQRKTRLANPERLILDQDVLVFDRAAALVLPLGAEAVDVRDRDLERFLVGVCSRPGTLIMFGIDRHISGLGRNAQARRLLAGRQEG